MYLRFLIIPLLCLGLVLPAQARDLTAAERDSLPVAIDSFRAALAAQDVVTVMSFVPPPILARMAERFGMTTPDMVRNMADRTEATGGLVTVHSVAVDLDGSRTLDADGEPYLLIPTEIVITFPNVGKVVETSHTLAFSEAGEWRLVRLGDPEGRDLLRMAYPRFAEIELPESVVEKLAP